MLKIERKQSTKRRAEKAVEPDVGSGVDPNSMASRLAPGAMGMNPVRRQQHFARHTAPLAAVPPQPPPQAITAAPVVKQELDFTQVMLVDALQSMQAVVESGTCLADTL